MSDLLAVAFDDPPKAFDLRARLVGLQKEYLIDIGDMRRWRGRAAYAE